MSEIILYKQNHGCIYCNEIAQHKTPAEIYLILGRLVPLRLAGQSLDFADSESADSEPDADSDSEGDSSHRAEAVGCSFRFSGLPVPPVCSALAEASALAS